MNEQTQRGAPSDIIPPPVRDQAHATEARLGALVEMLPEPIAVVVAGRIVFANDAMAKLLAFENRADLIGRNLLDDVHPEDHRLLLEDIARLERGDALQAGLELRFVLRDGLAIVVEPSAQRIQWGGQPGALAVFRNVTERRDMEARVRLADRMASIGVLAAGVAHEINNPLAYVLGNVDLVLSDLKAAVLSYSGNVPRPLTDLFERSLEALEEARIGAERIRRIVRDMNAFSRPDEDVRHPVDVRAVVDGAINMAWNEIRHRARLERDYDDVPRVMADEGRLAQVFVNLLVNAAQAIPEGKADSNVIRVAVRSSHGQVIIDVVDSGVGISGTDKGRIFDAFFTTKPVGTGTGLGLSICLGIVSSLGGSIEIDGAVGQGAAFRVRLPVAPAQAAAAVKPVPGNALATRRAAVLVIDDEPLVASIVARALEREHDVTVTMRAQEALDRIDAGTRFDVILCDLMMPVMSGADFYERLLQRAPEQAARVVFVTGGAFTEQAADFLERVPNRHLDKPFDARELRAEVNRTIACAGAAKAS